MCVLLDFQLAWVGVVAVAPVGEVVASGSVGICAKLYNGAVLNGSAAYGRSALTGCRAHRAAVEHEHGRYRHVILDCNLVRIVATAIEPVVEMVVRLHCGGGQLYLCAMVVGPVGVAAALNLYLALVRVADCQRVAVDFKIGSHVNLIIHSQFEWIVSAAVAPVQEMVERVGHGRQLNF